MLLRTACSTAIVLICATACNKSADAPLGRFGDNPTPYQAVLGIITDGSRLPAPGDDLTLYLGPQFDDAAGPEANALHVRAAHAGAHF